jgi:Fe2+ transport system protein FeoA
LTQSLWTLARGEAAIIESYDDALPEIYRNRLMELGFHPGERVSCLQAPALGAPRVYRVSNSTFSLDDEIARHLQVRVDHGDDL